MRTQTTFSILTKKGEEEFPEIVEKEFKKLLVSQNKTAEETLNVDDAEIRRLVSTKTRLEMLGFGKWDTEDLSFEKKKRKAKKAVTPTEKEKMRMLHSLPYSRYAQILENITFNRRIELIKVNPAYTSRAAEQKFCNRMKLNIHNGAAYVIARKGMGIKDKYLKKTG